MKKGLLFTLSIALCLSAVAQQVTQHFPNGFRRANIPASLKDYSVKVPLRATEIDNQVPDNVQGMPLSAPPITANLSLVDDEFLIGNTFYDLQTNNSISNRLSVNDDGTISAAWTFSPNSISGFPLRGSGYNYWDGANWLYPAGPTAREENIRTGFTNIVVTPISELLISHSIVGTDSSQITVAHRTGKGSGAWTISHPFGAAFHTWPKACAAGTSGSNNNVYMIWQGSGTQTTQVEGQLGPVYFSRSLDGGLNWEPKILIELIDSNYYCGFGGDSYSIDASGDTVAISLADTYTDVVLLKSVDGGLNWVKKIIQKHPIPKYACCNCGTFYIPNAQDTTVDTVYSNSGDSKVLIDTYGTCHVWFSRFDYHDDDSLDTFYNPHDGSDELFYWNESMPEDDGITRHYFGIASSQDFNGNGVIDVPVDTFTNCANRNPWGDYGGGVTQMPSAGINKSTGTIYLTYQALTEAPEADTTFYHALHRHVYMMTLSYPYDPYTWTYPYNIIPSIAEGGDGFNQEGVFACTGRNVDNTYAYVAYQRDGAPGHALAPAGTCDVLKNYGNTSDIVLARIDVTTVGIETANANDLFVSQNYPNPSVGVTFVNVGLKKSSKLKMEVYDLVGKVVYSETTSLQPVGNYSFRLNTSNWETGVYTYSVTANGEKTTRQMIVQ